MTRTLRTLPLKGRIGTALCVLSALLPAWAHADTVTDDWQWGATVYLWLPSLDGETSFPPSGDGPPIDVSTEALLDSINFIFMGALEGRKGRWGVGADVVYLASVRRRTVRATTPSFLGVRLYLSQKRGA